MMNESVKKSLEKSKNVLEEKRKIAKHKICIKKDKHVYNKCHELRSRAINHLKVKNQSVKKSLEKSKYVLEEKRRIVKRNFCIKKTHTFIIFAMNCVQEQLIT